MVSTVRSKELYTLRTFLAGLYWKGFIVTGRTLWLLIKASSEPELVPAERNSLNVEIDVHREGALRPGQLH